MDRRVFWALWSVLVAVCPIGLIVIELWYPNVDPYPPPWPSAPLPQRWAEGLLAGQVGVSLIAAPLVLLLTRRWPLRLTVWLGETILLASAWLLYLDIIFAKTGYYL
jgi:hypothetical protein